VSQNIRDIEEKDSHLVLLSLNYLEWYFSVDMVHSFLKAPELDRGISFSPSPRKGSEIMSQGEKAKVSLRTVWNLELLHHLILRFKEAEYES